MSQAGFDHPAIAYLRFRPFMILPLIILPPRFRRAIPDATWRPPVTTAP